MSSPVTKTLLAAVILSGIAFQISDRSVSVPDLPAQAPQFSSTVYAPSPTIVEGAAPSSSGFLPAAQTPTTSPGANELNDSDWRSLGVQIAEADRAFVNAPSNPGVFKAFNRSRNLAFTISADAVEIRPRKSLPAPPRQDPDSSADADWFVRLSPPHTEAKVPATRSEAHRIEIQRDGLTEWYVHREAGLEQGFTIESPPSGSSHDGITIDLPMETSLTPALATGFDSIQFLDASGDPALSYEKLHAFDADGRELPSRMLLVSAGATAAQDGIRLVVDTADATYPVIIDPLLTAVPLTIPEDTVSVAGIGSSADQKRVVALDGTTLAVGEVLSDGSAGAVSIFYRQVDGSWQLIKKIRPAGGGIRYFGSSVALDGDHLIVANRASPGGSADDGAYVFARNHDDVIDSWGQVKELQPSDANTLGFGNAVAIRGDWAFVGCQRGEFNDSTGRVYAYQRKEGGENNWGQVQRISAPAPEGFDSFGRSLATSPSGEFLVIGAPGSGGHLSKGAAHLYAAERGKFVHVAKLNPPRLNLENFGTAVAISGASLAASAPAQAGNSDFTGTVYIYAYTRSVDSQTGAFVYGTSDPQEILPPEEAAYKTFGHSLGLNTDYLCIGHDEAKAGVAFRPEPLIIYHRNRQVPSWDLSRITFDSREASGTEFGSSLALTETRLAVAAPGNGEVQVYTLEGAERLNFLGGSICVDDDTIAVGAQGADGVGVGTGAAYLFSRRPGNREPWGLQRKIMADDGMGGDRFGWSASLSGDVIVVGATWASNKSGAAYAFGRNVGGPGNWGQIQKFVPTDDVQFAGFGYSVGIWANRIVIGAPNQNVAYFYESGSLKSKHSGFVVGADDLFGHSVAIGRNFAVVGAPLNDFNAGLRDAGVAIVFKRDAATGDWSEFSTLTHTSPHEADHFGWSVAIDEGRVLVGAPRLTTFGTGAGPAYLFSPICAFTCTETYKLLPRDPEAYDHFGFSVALNGARAIVGMGNTGSPGAGGAIHLFEEHIGGADGWGMALRRTLPEAPSRNSFGWAVDIDGDTFVVGEPFHNTIIGRAYFYQYDANDAPTEITLSPSFVLENKSAGTVIGELHAIDPDAQERHTFLLVPGTGSADNASFTIDGQRLLTAAIFDYETRSTYQIRVRATDQTGAIFEKAFVVRILNDESEDLDGDGLTQLDEKNFGTSDNDRDSDGDGIEDGVEHHCLNSHPGDRNSGPLRPSITQAPATVTITWHSQPGITYVIDQREDLETGKWHEVSGSQVTATGLLTSHVVPINPPSAKRMFYHIRVPNCQIPPP